ncbi:MAG: hypothetical protein M1365_03240 [Actinobacteria bacterium]|nr:hypothetical protein [Actinomycetota bacterium]
MNIDPTGIGIEIVKGIPSIIKKIKNWWTFNLPAGRVLGECLNNNKHLKVYTKDLFVLENTLSSPKLFSQEGSLTQINPNIDKVWPEVEGKAIAKLFNLLGTLGKQEKIEIVEMSRGYGEWDSNMIVLGAQAVKCREFYEIMQNVAFGVNDNSIFNYSTKNKIEIDDKHGYGIILKARNPQNHNKPAFLLGGLGTLGTSAAVYYFINNVALLGKEFGKREFGIVVKARIVSGEQSTIRVKEYDRCFN